MKKILLTIGVVSGIAVVSFAFTAYTTEEHKVEICHEPPGNPENRHTISVDASAVPAHLEHGDLACPCEQGG